MGGLENFVAAAASLVCKRATPHTIKTSIVDTQDAREQYLTNSNCVKYTWSITVEAIVVQVLVRML